MPHLTKAHTELYHRSPDERFPSLGTLYDHCLREKESAKTLWAPPERLIIDNVGDSLAIYCDAEEYQLNDWSFSQLCRIADVNRDTVNKVSAATASRILTETMPRGVKPLQALVTGSSVRSVHGVTYTRLYNADVLSTVIEWAEGFMPPQEAATGGTGLYCGEQDMFCFLIDPTGWVEIEGEAFAPGFFVWNSEVGRRTVGIQSFWFQAVCQNHIVWDAVEVTEVTRKHTSNVATALDAIRGVISDLVEMRERRRDQFANVIRTAMQTSLGDDSDAALKLLAEHGFAKAVAHDALTHARQEGRFTIFSVVDALTRLSQQSAYAGNRLELDAKASRLLTLAA